MKAVIMAGGKGTRLLPLTKIINKHLLPIYDKPMIYYSLSTLMLADIRDILIVTNPCDIDAFTSLLGDGSQWGLNIQYKAQDAPKGVAEGLIVAEDFLNGEACCLILGDNILYRDGMTGLLKRIKEELDGATIFAYHVNNPNSFGVVEMDDESNVLSLEEKPVYPKSNYAAIGLYFYDNTASEKARSLSPSSRGELEITDLNKLYLSEGRLRAMPLGRGAAWLDTGTHASLLDASHFIRTIEDRQGLKIADLDDISKGMGFVS